MPLPKQMIAIEIDNGVLNPTKRATPMPSANQLLIKVAAAGVNRPDVMQRKGLYPPPPGASDIPGLEVAGTIVALGNNISHFGNRSMHCPRQPLPALPYLPHPWGRTSRITHRDEGNADFALTPWMACSREMQEQRSGVPRSKISAHTVVNEGDQVCALVTGGGYAEYCLASAALCLPVPEGLSFTQAAALPEAFFTVWSNVFDRAHLLPGETLLVHGGTSGIGTTAIQLAKAFNANVIVTAGSKAKCKFCLQLGADAAINYKEQDFALEIKRLTDNKGVDVILDMIGGDYFPRNLKCMADDARLMQIAIQMGPKAEINLLPIMLKRLTVTGSTLRARDDAFKAAVAGKLLDKVWPLLESGNIKPVIHSTFALTDAAKAHQLMESSQHIGKIILTV